MQADGLQPVTRRKLMKTTGAAAAATLAAPFVHTAGAAGSLSAGFWHHLGARRQHGYDADLRGTSREGEGQSHDRALGALGPRPCGQASRLAVQPLLIRAFQEMGPGNGRGGDTRHCAGAQLH